MDSYINEKQIIKTMGKTEPNMCNSVLGALCLIWFYFIQQICTVYYMKSIIGREEMRDVPDIVPDVKTCLKILQNISLFKKKNQT